MYLDSIRTICILFINISMDLLIYFMVESYLNNNKKKMESSHLKSKVIILFCPVDLLACENQTL